MTSSSNTMSGMGFQTIYPIEKFRQIKGPLIDLRSPKEYEQGHWPGAINVPLFNDKERSEIGTIYKKEGRHNAVLLGLEFIVPKISSLQDSLIAFKEENSHSKKEKPYLRLYCWRGGMRSSSVAWLANVLDLRPVILHKGYKSYRRWALEQFEKPWPLRLIGGRTGTGKTDLLFSLSLKGISVIDLEGLANHRGSSFGALGLPPQPSNEHYENLIAEKLESFKRKSNNEIWLEDESANLGRCRIPQGLFKQMKIAPLIEINRSIKERVENLVNVYGQQQRNNLEEATLRISKRLGPQRTSQALQAISEEKWDQACYAMLDYYDRCYEHQLSRVSERRQIDLSKLSAEQAAQMLIDKGLVY